MDVIECTIQEEPFGPIETLQEIAYTFFSGVARMQHGESYGLD